MRKNSIITFYKHIYNGSKSLFIGILLLLLCCWMAFGSNTSYVLADTLPQSELQALNEWPNWVPSQCADTSTYSSSANLTSSCCTGGSVSVPAGTLPSFIPEPYNGAFTQAADNHNVAPGLVAAIFSEERGFGATGSSTTPDTSQIPLNWASFIKQHPDPNSGWAISQSGAEGPFQFLPATWTGLGYNIGDINNLVIAADAAAKYLASNGATINIPETGWQNAIFSYKHAQWYVDAVLHIYDFYNSQPASTPVPGSTTTVNSNSNCSNGVVAGSIIQTALGLAWPAPGHGPTPTTAYVSAMQQYNSDGFNATGGLGNDCGVFVSTVMRASRVDPNYPYALTSVQANYVISHPEKYDIIYPATNTSQLQPGDILIINAGTYQDSSGVIHVGAGSTAGGHTFIYVGPQPPNGYNEASASVGSVLANSRSANLDYTGLTDGRGQYLIARVK